jgi:TonB-dependent starch-binding outer membrane protein SusC
MKTFTVLLLIAYANVFFVHAQTSLLDKKVRIEHRQGAVDVLLEEISNTGGFSFTYTHDILPEGIVSLQHAEQTVKQFLDELFPDGIQPIQFGNKLILKQNPIHDIAFELRGKVVDRETREPIPGVTVFIPETNPLIGSVTNKEGFFRLQVPSDFSTVQISCIGYESQSFKSRKGNKNTIELNPDNLELEEVVITYYQKPKDEEINGAISIIPAQILEQMPVPQIEDALQGNASGVHVVSNSGMPGASLQVKIRGVNSLINSDPVYYIDGIPVQQAFLYAISPRDIESIHVIKDEATLAGYGITAGNGVVLLNTKQGEPNSKTRFSFDLYAGRQELARKVDLMNLDEYRKYYYLFYPERKWPGARDTLQNTDWQDASFHPSAIQEYNLSASGGNKRSDYFISGGFYKQGAQIKNLQFSRYSFRINSNHLINPRLRFGQDISLSYLHFKGLQEGCYMNDLNNSVLTALIMPPFRFTEDEHDIALPGDYFLSGPNSHIAVEHNSRKNYALSIRLHARAELLPGLYYVTSFGMKPYYQDNITYTPTPPTFYSEGISEYKYHILDMSYYWQHMLNYTVFFSAIHKLDLTLSFDLGQDKGKWTPYEYTHYDDDLNYLPETTESGQGILGSMKTSTDFKRRSYGASLAYTFRDKLYLKALLRRDDVNVLALQHRFRKCFDYYPSISLGWIFTREPFFPKNGFLNYGKLRYGWGKAGISPVINYSFFAKMMQDFEYVYAINPVNFLTYSAIVRRTNEEFYLESAQSHNIGIDLGFFQNKLFFSADYFNAETKGKEQFGIENPKEFIEDLNLMYAYGIHYLPISHMKNRGFELGLSYKHHGHALSWNLNMNFSHVKNVILDANESELIALNVNNLTDPIAVNLPGEVVGSFYGYKIEGLFREKDCNENGYAINQSYKKIDGKTIYAQPYAREGDFKFADINGDSVIDKNDRVVLGNPIPDFIFGLYYHMEWKNFDFSMLFQGTYGNEIFNVTKLYLFDPQGILSWSSKVAETYRPMRINENGEVEDPGFTDTNLARINRDSQNMNLRASDFYLEDGSYIRLKNIQLGYTIDPKYTHKIHIQRFRVFIASQNLFTFTRYSGLDPEVGGWGIDCGAYPQPRVYMVGANVEF